MESYGEKNLRLASLHSGCGMRNPNDEKLMRELGYYKIKTGAYENVSWRIIRNIIPGSSYGYELSLRGSFCVAKRFKIIMDAVRFTNSYQAKQLFMNRKHLVKKSQKVIKREKYLNKVIKYLQNKIDNPGECGAIKVQVTEVFEKKVTTVI